MKRATMTLLLALVVLAVPVSWALAESVMPPMVPDPGNTRIASAKAAIERYRALDTWSGTWNIAIRTTPELRGYLKEKLNLRPAGSDTITDNVTIRCVRNHYEVRVDQLDKYGFVVASFTGTNQSLEITDIVESIQDMVLAASVNSWDYWAGNACYVGFSTKGWTAVYLDPDKGYIPSKILRGNFKVDGAASCVFSDYRQDEKTSRWTPWKMVDTLRVPGQDVVGKVITVTCLDFKAGE